MKKSVNEEYVLGLLDQESAKIRQCFVYSNINEYENLMRSEKIIGKVLSDLTPNFEIPFTKSEILKNLRLSHRQATIIKGRASKSSKFTNQLLTIAATVTLVANLYLFYTPQQLSTNYSYAVLSSSQLNSSWYANLQNKKLSLIPVNSYQKQFGHDLELWAITDKNLVISLGIIPPNKIVYLTMDKFINSNTTHIIAFAISNEKVGGSLTGQPQGEIVYNSDLQKLNQI